MKKTKTLISISIFYFISQIADDTLQQSLAIVTSAKILLLKCQDIQFELASVLDGQENSRPSGFYSASYQRAVGVVTETGNLVDAICSLYKTGNPLAEGKFAKKLMIIYHFQRCKTSGNDHFDIFAP